MPFDGTPHLIKPEGRWALDRGHPLARGLLRLHDFADLHQAREFDLVTETAIGGYTSSGTHVIGRQKFGCAYDLGANNGFFYTTDSAYRTSITNALTVFMVVEYVSRTATGLSVAFGNNDDAGAGGNWGLRCTAADKYNLFVTTGGGSLSATSATAATRSRVLSKVVGTFDGSNIRIYVDGVLESTVAHSGNVTQTGYDTCFNRNSGVSYWRNRYTMAGIANRVWSADEVLEWSEAPWAMLAPAAGWGVPAFKAAGGATFTVSATAPASPAVAAHRRTAKSLTGAATASAAIAKRIGKALAIGGMSIVTAIASFVGGLTGSPARLTVADGAAVACVAATGAAFDCAVSDAPVSRVVARDSAIA